MAASDDLLARQAMAPAPAQAPLAEAIPSTPVAEPRASDKLLSTFKQGQQQQLETVLDLASTRNPDKAAEAQQLAKRFGLRPEDIERDQDGFARMARIRDLQAELRNNSSTSPITARRMRDPDFAALAQDDLANLITAERTVGNAASDALVTAGKGAVGLPQAGVGMMDALYAVSPPALLQRLFSNFSDAYQYRGGYFGRGAENIGIRFSDAQSALDEMYSDAQQRANLKVAGAEGFLDTTGALLRNPSTIATGLVESAPLMLGGMGIARSLLNAGLKLSPLAAGAIGEGTIAGGSAAEQFRAANPVGELTDRMLLASLGSGTGTALFGMAGGKLAQRFGVDDIDTALASGQLTREAVQQGFLRDVALGGLSEGLLEELPQSAQEQIWANWAEEKPLLEGVPEAMAMGLVLGGAMGGGFAGITNLTGRFIKADDSDQLNQRLAQIGQLAAASKLLERDPQTFEEFVNQAAEEGPASHVFIDGNVLLQSGVAEELAQSSPAIAEQLQNAVATGGQVAIPVGEYAARIAPTEQGQALLEHLKFDPEGFTLSEAREFRDSFGEEIQADFEKAMNRGKERDAVRQSAEVVKQTLLGELNAVGTFTADVNEAYATVFASYYATRAQQLGVTPEQLFERRRVSFAGNQASTVGVLNQIPAYKDAAIHYDEMRNNFLDVVSEDADAADVMDSLDDFQPPLRRLLKALNQSDWLGFDYPAQALNAVFSEDAESFDLPSGVKSALGAFVNAGTGRVLNQSAQSTLPDWLPEDAGPITSLWAAIASNEDAFQTPRTDATDLNQILADVLRDFPGSDFTAEQRDVALRRGEETTPGYVVYLNDPDQGPIRALTIFDANSRNPFIEIGGEQLPQGIGLGHLYQAVGAWALNNGKTLRPDPRGLSEVNWLRRSEQMISNMLKYGQHRQWQPDGTQFAGLLAERDYQALLTGGKEAVADKLEALKARYWSDAEGADVTAANINNLAIASAALAFRRVPELASAGVNSRGEIVQKQADGSMAAIPRQAFAESLAGTSSPAASGVAGTTGQRVLLTAQAAGWTHLSQLGAPDRIWSESLQDYSSEGRPVRHPRAGVQHPGLARFAEGQPALESLLPQGGDGPRGTFNPETLTIALLKGADLSTTLHEGAHFFFENDIALAAEIIQEAETFGYEGLTAGQKQLLADVSALMKWHGIQGTPEEQLQQWYTMSFEEQRAHHERVAESFEAYLFSGNAPSIELHSYFQRFRSWMLRVYQSLKDFLARNPEAGKLNEEVSAVFDRMLATEEQIALAEQARNMLPLFENAEQAGWTPEEFEAYQQQGQEATGEAVADLQARGLRDMKWLRNARDKAIKRLQREAKALRSEERMEVRTEVMKQPVYQVWQFLTGKLQPGEVPTAQRSGSNPDTVDPVQDSLLTAIAKLGGLNKTAVVEQWGVDPASRPASGVFGKPVLRAGDKGLTPDAMGEALSELGYLKLDRNGKWDLAELERLFDDGLRGTPRYSNQYEPQTQEAFGVADLLGAGRLDLGALADMGLPEEVVNVLKARRMTAKEGLHPDLVAEVFGFDSGDAMVRALAAADKPAEVIEALTDVRMLEKHGELSTPEGIERAADLAVHNDARARFTATEANALARRTGKRKVLLSAARELARAMIGRQKIRDLRPGQYSNAEARAARAAEKALRAGDMDTAAAEKRNQLVQQVSAKAALDAREEIDKGLRYLRRFAGAVKSLDVEYLDQIHQLLERFDLRPRSLKEIDKRTSLANWLEQQREIGLEPELPPDVENEANRKHYRNMTVEEFRGLLDSVRQIEHLGRLKKKLLTAKDQREFQALVDEARASIEEHGGEVREESLEGEKGFKSWLEGFAASHRKLASLARQMDGGKDNGILWQLLIRPMNEAGAREATMNERATEALMQLYKPMLALKGGISGDKRAIPAIGKSLSRGGRLAVALNWGNSANRQRLMDGNGWTESQVQAILRTLTPVELQFVNDMHEFLDSFWPEVAAKEKRVTGIEPEKVAAEPWTMELADGSTVEMRGGYYPIKYDTARSDKAESHEAAALAQDMLRGAFTRSTTRRGHTKARAESVNRPLLLNLDVITQHVAQVTHDLAWHEWLIDATRLVKALAPVIRQHYGPEVHRTIKDGLAGIATADIVPQTKADTALLYLRAQVSRSMMGFSLTTALMQPFGLTQSVARIGGKHVLRGMARWVGDTARFQSTAQWISEKSEFMRLRNKTFNRELHEIKGRVTKGQSRARQIYDASLFLFMQKMQMVADVPTWVGAYEKAKAEGLDEDTAVALADQAVLDSQGGGQTKDLAELQRKHPMLTMFYSYFNTTYNLMAESTAKTNFRSPLAVAGWMSDMAMLMVIPAIGPSLLIALLRGEGEDKDLEDWAAELLRWQAGYALGLLVGVREFSGVASGFSYSGPPVGRVVGDVDKFGTQLAQGELDEALVTSGMRALGAVLGIPSTQLVRSWKGWQAWEDGDAPVTSILVGPPAP